MTPNEERALAIHNLRAQADLLFAEAVEPSMKLEVASALRDLADAERWLASDARPPRMIDGAIMLADWKLQAIKEALSTEGPDATFPG